MVCSLELDMQSILTNSCMKYLLLEKLKWLPRCSIESWTQVLQPPDKTAVRKTRCWKTVERAAQERPQPQPDSKQNSLELSVTRERDLNSRAAESRDAGNLFESSAQLFLDEREVQYIQDETVPALRGPGPHFISNQSKMGKSERIRDERERVCYKLTQGAD